MTTPNLGLSSTSQSSGSLVTFLNWRLLQDADNPNSNMGKIDAWAGGVSASLVEILEEKIHIINGSGDGATFSANETDILSYFEGLTINLTLDVTNTGVTTLNINGLGDKFLKKMVAGVRTSLSAGDLGIGAYNLFVYSTGEFIWIGYESTTIHSNTSGEINGITGKTTPVDTDITIIEDSAFTYSKKKLTWANIKATLKDYFDTLYPMDNNVFHKNINGEILALTEKALPISEGSGLLMEDEAIGGGIKRKLSWAGIKSSLKSYFDAIYAGISKGVTNGDSHDHLGGDGDTIAHSSISGSGINTHTQIDTFINSKGIANGLASLTSGSLVEQNPANATATPTANKIPIADANALLTPWVIPGDWPLKDATNGDHFLQNAASYPAGWTEADAPVSTNTNEFKSFWNINGSSVNLDWKYRKQTGINIENLAANSFRSFLFGPIYFRDGQYPVDIVYRFGVYRNNAGVIDEQTYIRAVLKWISASATWQAFMEEKDGTTAHSSTAKDLSFPLPQPLYFRVVIRNDATKLVRGYVGLGWTDKSHSLLLTQTPTAAPTWGQVWLQIEKTRIIGGGVDDYLFLGSVDVFETTG